MKNTPVIILGIGTGKCGSYNLTKLFEKQRIMKYDNSFINKLFHCIHEGQWFDSYCEYNDFILNDNLKKNTNFKVKKYIETVIDNKQEYEWPGKEYHGQSYKFSPFNFHIHISYNLLNVVETFINLYINIKVICLKREKELFIDSVIKTYYSNISSNRDRFFVKYFITNVNIENCDNKSIIEKAEKFWGNYWDNYYKRVEQLILKYPSKIKLYNLNVLNNESVQKEMLEFCGFNNPVIHTKWKIKNKINTDK